MPELAVLAEQLLAPVPGGTGRYTRELAVALAAIAPRHWAVVGVIGAHSDPGAAAIPGVEGPRVLPLPRRALIGAWEHGMPLWPGGDAVHAPTPLAPAAPRRGHTLVVTVHDTVPWTHPETLTRRGVAWHRKVIARAVQRANAVVVPTNAVAEELRNYAPGTTRVHVVPNGVPSAFTEPADPAFAKETAERLRLPDRYVLTVGTVEPRKGLSVLIDALSRPQAPDLPLVVVGAQGWGGVNLHALAAGYGLPPWRLHVLGELSDAELAVVLRRATVLAAPSIAEGFGLPVLEAMAVGVPVVHTDVPALLEVAGGTGLVVRRNDPVDLAGALRRALADSSRMARSVAEARRRAAGFTWRRAAEAVWELHLELYETARRDSA